MVTIHQALLDLAEVAVAAMQALLERQLMAQTDHQIQEEVEAVDLANLMYLTHMAATADQE